MDSGKITDCEQTQIERWSKFQLSNKWKQIGFYICILIFVALLILKFVDIDTVLPKDIFKRGLLVGLLIVSLSKDKYEDEMIVSLRAKSYTLAFVFGVLYTLIQPLAEFVVNIFVLDPKPNNSFSYFEVLSFMLVIQIAFFEVLKRNR